MPVKFRISAKFGSIDLNELATGHERVGDHIAPG
jgi:hypothetical protein